MIGAGETRNSNGVTIGNCEECGEMFGHWQHCSSFGVPHPVVHLKCAECGHVDTVYAGSLSAQSCPNCKHPRPAQCLESASPPPKAAETSRASDSRREALSDAAKATCEKCARGEAVEFQADPTPMYWHRAVECDAAPIHALLARAR